MTDEEKKIMEMAKKIVTVKLNVGQLMMFRHALAYTKPSIIKEVGEDAGERYDYMINKLSLLINDFPDLKDMFDRALRHEEKLKTCVGDCGNCEFQDDMKAFKAKAFDNANMNLN